MAISVENCKIFIHHVFCALAERGSPWNWVPMLGVKN